MARTGETLLSHATARHGLCGPAGCAVMATRGAFPKKKKKRKEKKKKKRSSECKATRRHKVRGKHLLVKPDLPSQLKEVRLALAAQEAVGGRRHGVCAAVLLCCCASVSLMGTTMVA